MEEDVGASEGARRHGHRLLQAGSVLFLLGLLVGLAVPRFSVPRLGLSAHLLAITQGTLLMVAGVVWPRLRLTRGQSSLGSVLAIYGCAAAWTANCLGAVWGAGSSMLPLAAGGARGTALEEGLIRVLLVSAALSLISFGALLFWGLRGSPRAGAGQ
jgi:hypothetical protein